MPRSKDVDAYSDDFFQIAAIMRTNKDFVTGWMPLRLAKRMRYTWFAFVRAHYATIDRASANISNLRLTSKDPLASDRIGPARNILMLNRAREARLDVIRRFEAVLEIDINVDEDKARLRFRDKSIPYEPAGIAALFAALPAEQQRFEEQIQMEMESPASGRNDDGPMIHTAPMPDLSEFFTMPIEDKIRSGIANEEDFKSSTLDHRTLRELVLAVEDNSSRSRMLGYLPPIDGIPVQVLPLAPLILGGSRAQLDSPPGAGYPAPATTAEGSDIPNPAGSQPTEGN